MTGKELVLKALRGEETPRPAWVPYVGSHGGFLLDITAREYLTSADRIVEGLTKAKEVYNADGLPVIFDLQIEAEVLGCDLHWAEDGPPSVKSHPLEGKDDWTAADVPELDLTAGRIPLALEATRKTKAAIGGDTALYGLICGPFTLALHLLGNDIFMEMYDEEEKVEALTMRCAEIGKWMASAYLEAGCDVIAVVDPMVSQISPEHFEQFVTPAMNALYDHIRAAGGISCCFVCGDVTRNLELMCATTCDSVSVDEQIDMAKLRDIALPAGKSFGGNLKLTLALLMGTADDARRNAIDTIDACGNTGFILSPGCDLPFNTPPANVAAAGMMALDEYARETARANITAAEADSFDDVVLPDYATEEKVILDVVTLDSLSCAPCQYMKDAADDAATRFEGRVEVREHKIKNRHGVGMLVKLGCKNLPTICIDGTPTFESIIPDQKHLDEAIRARVELKSTVGV